MAGRKRPALPAHEDRSVFTVSERTEWQGQADLAQPASEQPA